MIAKLADLRSRLRSLEAVVVAFSGGVDSSLLARISVEELGDLAVAVTAVSPSLLPSELDDCRRLVEAWGMRWAGVETDELANPAYRSNAADRCFHCKSELMTKLLPVAAAEGATVVLGVNVDDLSDYRPGQTAARERGAEFPLVDCGFGKDEVRQAARELGIAVWDKPSAACLASRVPYGTPVTLKTLRSVAAAEEALRAMGYRQLRVRHYGELARVELDPADFGRVVQQRERVVAAVRGAGYTYVTLDLEGFRSGNLNQALEAGGSAISAGSP